MIINAWLGCRDGFNDDIRAAIEAEDYDGPIAEDILELFKRSSDHSAVLPLYAKNGTWNLWSVYFDFEDDDQFQYPQIEMPEDPVYPEWTGGDRPVYPQEPIPTDEDGFPLFSRAEIVHPPYTPIPTDENGDPLPETPEELAARLAADQAIHDAWHALVTAQQVAIAAWEATPEFEAWEAEVDAYDDAEKDWSALRKQWRKDYEAVDKPHRKAIAKLKAAVRKQGRAFTKANETVAKALTDLPTDLVLLGAWFWDGGLAMPIDNQLLKYMPDVPDGFKANGDPKYKKATEIVDVNLGAGQSPRDFDDA